jgi:hypothetical protein
MQKAHVGDIINVDFRFEDYDEGLAVQLDGENGGGEE